MKKTNSVLRNLCLKAVLCCAFWGTHAAAEQILVIGRVQGAGGAQVAQQLKGVLCPPFRCVMAPKLNNGGKLNWEKAHREHIAGVLTVTRQTSEQDSPLDLELTINAGGPAKQWSKPAQEGRLSKVDLAQILADVQRLAVVPPVQEETLPERSTLP